MQEPLWSPPTKADLDGSNPMPASCPQHVPQAASRESALGVLVRCYGRNAGVDVLAEIKLSLLQAQGKAAQTPVG